MSFIAATFVLELIASSELTKPNGPYGAPSTPAVVVSARNKMAGPSVPTNEELTLLRRLDASWLKVSEGPAGTPPVELITLPARSYVYGKVYAVEQGASGH
jgi:hypothetical protein